MTFPKIIQEVLNRVSFNGAQTLTDNQKAQVRTNIGAIDNSDVVSITGAQTVTGAKTFSASPTVPTPNADDDSQKAVNTAWVTDILESDITAFEGIASGQNPTSEPLIQPSNIVTVNGAQTVSGDKNFTGALQHNGYGVDSVVASGTNYIRYESGLQICFAHVANLAISTQSWGSVYEMTITTPITFPMPFIEAPRISVQKSTTPGAYGACTCVVSSGTTITEITFIRATNITGSIGIDYIAIGFWK